ncbi:MAG: hypothetical protein A2X12_06895 [Bacteroidetes bacterium GWE2_29_8]|nr:MAG: hypothetical protein A2X12_06895 [Bacteroidetes bacterium GWE2_29_8]
MKYETLFKKLLIRSLILLLIPLTVSCSVLRGKKCDCPSFSLNNKLNNKNDINLSFIDYKNKNLQGIKCYF